MQKSYRFILFVLLLGAYLLSACSGALPQQDNSSQGPADSQSTEVVFTGTVQSVGGGQWLISGQLVDVDGLTRSIPTYRLATLSKWRQGLTGWGCACLEDQIVTPG